MKLDCAAARGHCTLHQTRCMCACDQWKETDEIHEKRPVCMYEQRLRCRSWPLYLASDSLHVYMKYKKRDQWSTWKETNDIHEKRPAFIKDSRLHRRLRPSYLASDSLHVHMKYTERDQWSTWKETSIYIWKETTSPLMAIVPCVRLVACVHELYEKRPMNRMKRDHVAAQGYCTLHQTRCICSYPALSDHAQHLSPYTEHISPYTELISHIVSDRYTRRSLLYTRRSLIIYRTHFSIYRTHFLYSERQIHT